MNLFRKKDIAHLAQDAEKSGFVRNLTAFDLVFLGIGSVIGTGIFVLTGVGAALYAGPGIAISFILASVACAFAGLAYAEYSSMVPVSGSAYAYTYASLGEFMAFLVGWNLILEYTVTCSTVAAGWSGYVVGLLTSGGLNLSIDFLKVPAEGGIITSRGESAFSGEFAKAGLPMPTIIEANGGIPVALISNFGGDGLTVQTSYV